MQVLKLRPDIVWRVIGEEAVVLEERSSTYFSTNAAATLLWDAIAQGTSRDALIGSLVDAFDIDTYRATVDVDAFLAELSEQGLLESPNGQP